MTKGWKGFIWNPTNIDEATYCRKKWYLIHRLGVKKPITGSMAKGIIIHRAAEYAYKKSPETGRFVLRYHSAEDFANAIAGKKKEKGHGRSGGWWNLIVGRGTIQGKKINWKDDVEPWTLREEIWKMCYNLYEIFSKEPAPIYTEYKIPEFEICGLRFNGRIDQLLYGPKIIDIKSGYRVPNEMKLKYDPQFTLYCLAVGCLCHTDKKFAESLGVSEEEAREWGGNPIYLSEKIEMEYLMPLEKKRLQMKRDDIKFYDFIDTIWGLQTDFEEGRVYSERGRLCDYCEINKACDDITNKTRGRLIIEPQLKIFEKTIPIYVAQQRTAIQKKLYSKTNIRKTQEINNRDENSIKKQN